MSALTPEQQLLQKQQQAHQEWLKHPITQDFIKILFNRGQEYTLKLQEGILVISDKEKEDKLRVAITTCKAIHIITTDSEQFVQHQNKIKQ